MGLGSILKTIGNIGSVVAAPFTGGASLALPAILGGVSAVGGALENTKGARTSTMTPTLDPQYQNLAGLLRQRAEDRLRSSADLSGYTANGIQGINQAFGGVQQALNNNLTTRGLASSPVAGAVDEKFQLGRAGNIADYLNTIPLLQRQLQSEDMSAALPVVNLGRGTSSVAPGSVAGGALSSAAEMLAYLHGRGIMGGTAQPEMPGQDLGGIMGGIRA